MASFPSIWPALGLTGLALLVVSAPWFSVADKPPNENGNRFAALDGLRGYAAFAVFIFHSALYHFYLLNGIWAMANLSFYAGAAAAVSLFFMITGYLFWGKLLDDQGRPDWILLYIGRLFRIGPLYLFAIGTMLLIVFAAASFRLQEAPSTVAREIASWLQLGASYRTPDVNGFHDTNIILAGVTWTLFYEWRFYAALILLGPIARVRSLHLVVPAFGVLAGLALAQLDPPQGVTQSRAVLATLFCFGMLAASLERAGLLPKIEWLKNFAFFAGWVVYFLLGGRGYTPLSTAILGVIFYLVVSGANPFGILTSRVSKRLGDMSFSIYLLQGLVLKMVFAVPVARTIALASATGHWAMMTVCALVLLAVSRMTFIYIERPGINLGKRLTKAIGLFGRNRLKGKLEVPHTGQAPQ